MTQNTDDSLYLARARLLLEEGNETGALTVLRDFEPRDERAQLDHVYLSAWCALHQRRWDEMYSQLSPLLVSFQEMVTEDSHLERERYVISLLRLGLAAVTLSHFEDASLHLTSCLRILHDRRVHLPQVRVRARYFLALTCSLRGLYEVAIQHYEEALRVCQRYHDTVDLPHIYYGLCDTHCQMGAFEKSWIAGQTAIRYYQEQGAQLFTARVYNILGRTCMLWGKYGEASEYYNRSLALATTLQLPAIAMGACASLADLYCQQGQLVEAKRYALLAINTIDETDNAYLRGSIYTTMARVLYAEAENEEEPVRVSLLDEALHWYDQAYAQLVNTQAYPRLAEVAKGRAQIFEKRGCSVDALAAWRVAYQMLGQ